MKKRLIHQDDIAIVNIYIPSIGAFKCIKQILTELKENIDSSTQIVRDLNIPTMGRSLKEYKTRIFD